MIKRSCLSQGLPFDLPGGVLVELFVSVNQDLFCVSSQKDLFSQNAFFGLFWPILDTKVNFISQITLTLI